LPVTEAATEKVAAFVNPLHPEARRYELSLLREVAQNYDVDAIVFDRLPARPADGALVHAYGRVEFWRPRSIVRMRVERLVEIVEPREQNIACTKTGVIGRAARVHLQQQQPERHRPQRP